MNIKEVNFWYWVVKLLPVKLVYFSFMHVMAHSTTGKYENTIVPDLTWIDAVDRYSKDNNI